MAYIEAHQSLNRHPKMKQAARDAGIEQVAMLGYLLRFWWWCLDYAPDGDLGIYENADIEDGVDWEGKANVLVDAFVRAGFIDVNTARWSVHDWSEYGGKLLQKRLADAERKRNERARTSDGHPTDIPVTAQVDNNRIDKSKQDKKRAEQQQQHAPEDDEKSLVVVAMMRAGILISSHDAILTANPALTPEDVDAFAEYVKKTNTVRNGNPLTPGWIVSELKAGHRAPEDCYLPPPDPDAEKFVLE